jgi:hypothetical protein
VGQGSRRELRRLRSRRTTRQMLWLCRRRRTVPCWRRGLCSSEPSGDDGSLGERPSSGRDGLRWRIRRQRGIRRVSWWIRRWTGRSSARVWLARRRRRMERRPREGKGRSLLIDSGFGTAEYSLQCFSSPAVQIFVVETSPSREHPRKFRESALSQLGFVQIAFSMDDEGNSTPRPSKHKNILPNLGHELPNPLRFDSYAQPGPSNLSSRVPSTASSVAGSVVHHPAPKPLTRRQQ